MDMGRGLGGGGGEGRVVQRGSGPTHLDGVRGGPLAVDQQHVIWRELDLAIGVGDLEDARALLRGCRGGGGGVWGYRGPPRGGTEGGYSSWGKSETNGGEGGRGWRWRASLSLCWLTMTRVNSYAWSLPALRT